MKTKLARVVLDAANRILGLSDNKGGVMNLVTSQVHPVTGKLRFLVNGQIARSEYAPYLGFVGTNGAVSNSTLASFSSLTSWSRAASYATTDITDLRMVWGNFYVSGGEQLGAGPMSIKASVEYPAGTFTQVTFSGNVSGTCAAGATITSDASSVFIPKGARFWVRQYFTSAAFSIHYISTVGICDTTVGEAFNHSTTTLSDPTMGGAMTDAGGGAIISRPLAYIGTTTKSSYIIFGDSRNAGSSDTLSNGFGFRGELTRAIGPNYGYSNCSVGGSTLASFNTASALQRSLLPYATHVVCAYGVNDLIGGASAATIEGNLGTLYANVSGGNRTILQTTFSPAGVTSTDAYATVANQTADPHNAARIALNAWVRAIPAPLAGVIEVADLVESARDSGKWNAPGYTTDGTHAVRTANEIISRGVKFTQYEP